MSKEVDVNTWQGLEPYLNNILNEVLNGFYVNYPEQLGTTRSELFVLFDKVRSIDSEQMFTPEEARLLSRVARLCDAELGVEEFKTRTGYTLEESQHVQARLERIALVPLHATAS